MQQTRIWSNVSVYQSYAQDMTIVSSTDCLLYQQQQCITHVFLHIGIDDGCWHNAP